MSLKNWETQSGFDKTEILKHIPQKENRITRDKTLLTNKDTPTSGEQMPPWLTYTTKETELNILGFIYKKKNNSKTQPSHPYRYGETSTLLHGDPLQ